MCEKKRTSRHRRESQTSDPDQTSAVPTLALPWLGKDRRVFLSSPPTCSYHCGYPKLALSHPVDQALKACVLPFSEFFTTWWSDLSSNPLALSNVLVLTPKGCPWRKNTSIPSLERVTSSDPNFADRYRAKPHKDSHLPQIRLRLQTSPHTCTMPCAQVVRVRQLHR